MKTEKYERNPVFVEAVRVTEENLIEVATWAQGSVEKNTDGDTYIRVRVIHPLSERQTMAFAGDWVLYSASGTGYKVYPDKAFQKSYRKVKGHLSPEDARSAGIRPPLEVDGKPVPR